MDMEPIDVKRLSSSVSVDQSNKKARKRVSFSPYVKFFYDPTQNKQDRKNLNYRPDLTNNILLCSRVGGNKNLAAISLMYE